MAIPSGFNDKEHVQALIRRYVNRLIRRDFKDLNNKTGSWEPNVNTTRAAMRYALEHKNGDSLLLTNARLMLYYFTYGEAKNLQPDYFAIPIPSNAPQRKFRPQVTLYFTSDRDVTAVKSRPKEAEIAFRLMDESEATITQTEINAMATRIKNLFAVPTKFIWKKGKTMYSYTDWDRGYQLQVLSINKTEAKDVIKTVMDIQNHTPDWKRLIEGECDEPLEAYPNNPGKTMILGQQVDNPQLRPVVDVKFRYATLTLPKLKRGINLVDTTGRRRNPIEIT